LVSKAYQHLKELVWTFYKKHFMSFIKHYHWLNDEGHNLFSVQFFANQLVILSLLQFQKLLTLSPFSLPSLLLSMQGIFYYSLNFSFYVIFFPLPKKVPFPYIVLLKHSTL
jgi:hypothetical protein